MTWGFLFFLGLLTSTHKYISIRLYMARPTPKAFSLLAETFQCLGDSSRVQIIWALSEGELLVGNIAKSLSMSQPAVSYHLRTLRNLRLVKVRRDGRSSYYSLDDAHINRLLKEGMRHVDELL